jgi:hypothetical protein
MSIKHLLFSIKRLSFISAPSLEHLFICNTYMTPESLRPEINAGIAALQNLKDLIEYRNSLVGKK